MVRLTFLLLWGLVPGRAQVLTPNTARAGQEPASPIQQATIEAEDGTPFAISPQIIRDAGSSCDIVAVFGSGLVQFRYVYPRVHMGADQWPCMVKIVAAGYRTVRAQLRGGQLIVLKRLGVNEGYTISLQSLSAPAGARKEYELGEQDLARKKWARAEEHLERAVALYPELASAWSELGTARQRLSQTAGAEQALRRALEADPKYLKPYAQLAELLGDEERWADSLALAERALRLNPAGFPQVACEHARASLHMGNLEAAERSAREAVASDLDRAAPQAEYILGEVLEARGDRPGAVERMKKYLVLDKHGKYADSARKRLIEWK